MRWASTSASAPRSSTCSSPASRTRHRSSPGTPASTRGPRSARSPSRGRPGRMPSPRACSPRLSAAWPPQPPLSSASPSTGAASATCRGPRSAAHRLGRLSALDFLSASARQAAGLRELDHRPWPLPAGSWRMGQCWEDLLFAHSRVSEAAVRALVPEALEIDTFDGSAWVGVTPFRISCLRLRGTLPLPYVSSFLELNVRTYVTAGEKPGIWFFSLDAESQLAVKAARRAYQLPYHRARMSARAEAGWIEYESARVGAEDDPHVFSGFYRPRGEPLGAEPGS